MKKFILFAAAAVAFAFAACSNNSEKTEEAAEVHGIDVDFLLDKLNNAKF